MKSTVLFLYLFLTCNSLISQKPVDSLTLNSMFESFNKVSKNFDDVEIIFNPKVDSVILYLRNLKVRETHERYQYIKTNSELILTFNIDIGPKSLIDSIDKIYYINSSELTTLLKQQKKHKILYIGSLSLGDCSGCSNILILNKRHLYVEMPTRRNTYCYPENCYPYSMQNLKQICSNKYELCSPKRKEIYRDFKPKSFL